MSVKLMVEVLDRYHGPFHRKLWLIAFAERANVRTRTGWPSREELARRCGVTPGRATKIAAELIAEGAVKRVGGPGHRGRATTYTLLPLPGLVAQDATSPKRTGGPGRHQSRARNGGAERRNGGAKRPTGGAGQHPNPQTLINPHPPEGAASLAPTAQTILGAFIDWDRDNGGKLTRQTIGQLARHIDRLLAEGIDDKHIRQGLAAWRAKRCNPSALHSFVDAAMGGPAPPAPSRRQSERDAMFDRAMARARARDAARAAGSPGGGELPWTTPT
jgi:hypothetical protein